MSEYLGPEIVSAEIDFVRKTMVKAIEPLGEMGVNSEGLCSTNSFAIALRLNKTLNIPIKVFDYQQMVRRKSPEASIGFVDRSFLLKSHNHRINHNFLFLIGVSENPILLDGSNDQLDPQVPFLCLEIPDIFLKTVRNTGRVIRRNNQREHLSSGYRKTIPNVLDILLKSSEISRHVYDLANQQHKFEAGFGLEELMITTNRDWLEYLCANLGIEYPSVEVVRRKFQDITMSVEPEMKDTILRDRAVGTIVRQIISGQ